jgi:hypothetical protein
MYINFKLLSEKNISPDLLITLQLLKQLRVEDLDYSNFKISISKLEELGYVDRLKDSSPRISKEGAKLLDIIQIPNVTENHVAMAEYLIDKYKEDPDKILCSKNKLIELISWFCSEANITARELYKILLEYWESDDSRFNKKLDYLFFKPENAYSKRNINDSRLFIWYQNNLLNDGASK